MEAIQKERNQVFLDVYNGDKPSRVPITITANIEAPMEYFGYSILRDLYSPKICYDVADKFAKLIDTDTLPVSPATTPATVFRYTGQKFMTRGDDGFFQHPDLAPMDKEEYPEFISDPFSFIVNKIQPRVYSIFDDQPELGHIRIKIARQVVNAQYQGMTGKLIDKHQRTNVMASAGITWAPFDFIADYIRSFSTIVMDMRRNSQWVLDACDAVLEYEIKQINSWAPPAPGKITEVILPLHMPPFMRPKDVEKFYWPTYKKLIEAIQNRGYVPSVFYEQDWSAHMDLISDLPGKHVAKFESTPIELISNKVPTRNVCMSSYPLTLLSRGSKEQCVDEAKRILDVLAPAGNYIFCPNKRFIRASDMNIENMQAVIECVREYGKYE